MARIAVVHHVSSSRLMGLGGAELVALETVLGLREAGHEAYIVTYHPPGPREAARLGAHHGISPGEAMDLFTRPRRMRSPDLVINTSGDVLAGLFMGYRPDIVYLHYPLSKSIDTYYPGLRGAERLAGKIYALINKVFAPHMLVSAKAIIANSMFTARILAESLHRRIYVVHPPVKTSDLTPPLPRNRRKMRVLVVSRFSPEKNLEYVVVLSHMLTRLGVEARIAVAGSTGRYSRLVVKRLKRLMENYGVDNIDLYMDLPRRRLAMLYRNSMVYVHLTRREHFGISVVEAMAAGTPPVVPEESGAWLDAAGASREHALPYRSLWEAAENVARLLRDKELWNRISRGAAERARCFDSIFFRKRIAAVVEEVLG